MLSARVAGIGEALRCVSCGRPGEVAVTDLPPSLRRDGRRTAVYCRNCAAEVVLVVRMCAEVLTGDMAGEAREYARTVEVLLREVPPCVE